MKVMGARMNSGPEDGGAVIKLIIAGAVVGGLVMLSQVANKPNRTVPPAGLNGADANATASADPHPTITPFTDRLIQITSPHMGGNGIDILQKKLNEIGCGEASELGGPVTEDGYFGGDTEKAVEFFQRNHPGSGKGGVVDESTQIGLIIATQTDPKETMCMPVTTTESTPTPTSIPSLSPTPTTSVTVTPKPTTKAG